jgi:hypothetical protein
MVCRIIGLVVFAVWCGAHECHYVICLSSIPTRVRDTSLTAATVVRHYFVQPIVCGILLQNSSLLMREPPAHPELYLVGAVKSAVALSTLVQESVHAVASQQELFVLE